MNEKPIRVLLVEADPAQALPLQRMLTEASPPCFEPERADRLSSGLKRLADGDIDVVLLDLALPDSRGLETLALAHAVAPQVPIVLLTEEAEATLAAQAVHHGAQDYLIKGEVSAPLLVRSIRYAIELHQAQLALRSLSLVDELTGLYNRRGFLALAARQHSVARRTGHRFVLLFADLDGLKQVNDTFGHAEGDRALIATAEVLRRTFRDSDIIARLGGDEFVVLAIDANGASPEWAADRLQEKLKQYLAQKPLPYPLSLSVGVVEADPYEPVSIEDVLARADAVMYAEKRSKRLVERKA